LWRQLGLGSVELQLNSLGTPASRAAYRDELVDYFSAHKDSLDEEGLRRLQRNPMRLLDSKEPGLQSLVNAAPRITDHLDAESAEHFALLQARLTDVGIKFVVNTRLVRGLDYYTRTVFEWVTDQLGAQGAICSGGRYDGLVEHLGGKPTPAIGWAIGMERLVELVRMADKLAVESGPDVYLVAVGDAAASQAFKLAESIRDAAPDLAIEVNNGGGSFKSQFKRADKSGAAVALILGADELESGTLGVKSLRSDDEQQSVAWGNAVDAIRAKLN
jgi:histidyl-tRNA synthetase